MDRDELEALRARTGAASTLEAPLLHEVADAVRGVFPNAPAHPEALAEPTEAVLHLVDRCLPGWSITLKGHATEPDGHWRCSLRRSSGRDDDDVIGQGRAPTVPLAVLMALLSVACHRAPARTA
jgi:hypothetical protein